MSNETPVFQFQESQHYSDYGFDPQLDYFQVLEEARKHKRDCCYSRSKGTAISKDENSSKKIKKNKKRWWKNALLFFKRKWPEPEKLNSHRNTGLLHHRNGGILRASMSGPVYITESRSGSSTPYLTTRRPSSGPLAGILSPAEKGELQIPYISLREINMDQHHSTRTKSASSLPIYLVT